MEYSNQKSNRDKEYREKNKEKIAHLKKRWYEKNKNKILEKLKLNKEKNKERQKEYNKKYKIKNRDKINQQSRNIDKRFAKAKNRAKRKNIIFNLSLEEFSQEATKPCYYCANLLGKPSVVGVGLDRKDSTKGYTIDNVVACCTFCNTKKSHDLTVEETKIIMRALINFRKLD